ncbi:MAG: alpha/beta fold hydrolase [Natronospirillum sp.]
MPLLPYEEINPSAPADSAVIWLHGLGADGHDFVPIVPELKLPSTLATRFIFPHAPSLPVTVNGGMVMPAWYDILDISIDRKVDVEQLSASATAILELVQQEIDRGIDSKRIVLAGFSQGGAVAYHAALGCDKPLAGLLAMSTYFATADNLTPHPNNAELPVLIQHGDQDPIVPEQLGRAAQSRLTAMGYKPEYQVYPMPHSVHPQQVQAISQWLQAVLN